MSGSKIDLKVVLLGQECGGKTSLMERYLHDRFNEGVPYQSTIGAAFVAKKEEVSDRTVTLGIWDTAGSERYQSVSSLYYRGAKAAILCYDLTDDSSFSRARFWVDQLLENEEDCKIYLCGTKFDLVEEDKKMRRVDYHDTTDYADEINAQVFETSSKTGFHIKELFFKIAKDFLEEPQYDENGEEDNNVLNITAGHQQKKPCRC